MQNREFIIKQVDATMSMEGMPLTETDKERIRLCIGDNKKVEDTISALVSKYTMRTELKYEQGL